MYPSFYPVNCPPPEASAQILEAYRLARRNPPEERDFLPSCLAGMTRVGNRPGAAKIGTSMFTDREDARWLNGTIRYRPFKIAVGRTHPQYGVVLRTPSQRHPSHITYWILPGTPVHNHFRACLMKLRPPNRMANSVSADEGFR
jgi:hypothetical protein